MNGERGAWAGRLGFILAAAGSAVGLGNLWKFPYLAYKAGGEAEWHGAGAFVFVYLLAVALVCIPVMIAEIMIGRRGRRNPVGAFRVLRPGSKWPLVGYLGVLTGSLILAYYSVVAGWTVEYIYKAAIAEFSRYEVEVTDEEVRRRVCEEAKVKPETKDCDRKYEEFLSSHKDPEDLARALKEKRLEIYPDRLFHAFLASPVKQVGFLFVFMAITAAIVLGGVSSGIERWSRILMPLLYVMLLGLVVRVATLPGGLKALDSLFVPDFSRLDLDLLLLALGQAFFSLSLGMGAMLTYGSYLSPKERISSSAFAIAGLDTLVALMAAFVIFGAISSYGLSIRGAGIGNLFTAVPVIFLHMPGGTFLTIVFYVLAAFAALTSTVSLLEVASAYLIDEHRISRPRAVILAASVIFALGVPCALSFNLLSDFKVLGLTCFDIFDYTTSNLALPAGGILISLFAGWMLRREEQIEELFEVPGWAVSLWRFSVRFVAPLAIFAVLVGLLLGRVVG